MNWFKTNAAILTPAPTLVSANTPCQTLHRLYLQSQNSFQPWA